MEPHSFAESHAASKRLDPSLEAIYALNIGDFILEHFISDDLLTKINDRIAQEPDKLRRQLAELLELYPYDKILGMLGGESPEISPSGQHHYHAIARALREMFQVDACHLFQKDALQASLTLAGSSIPVPNEKHKDITLSTQSKDVLIEAYFGAKTMVLEPKGKDRLNWHPVSALGQASVESLMATPLLEGKKPIGLLVLESYHKTNFTPEQRDLADAAGRAFVTGIRIQQLLKNVAQALNMAEIALTELTQLRAQVTESIADLGIHQQAFLEALSYAVDARQEYTQGHSKRVGEIARFLAETMGLNEKTCDLIYYAGLFGPLGKVFLPSEGLNQSTPLDEPRKQLLKDSPREGAGFLAKMHFFSEMIPYLYAYRERWDGSGGPDALTGRNIPLGSRILAVADSYYAMTCERPYREKRLTHSEAIETLQKEAGSKWDPQVVEKFSMISEADLA